MRVLLDAFGCRPIDHATRGDDGGGGRPHPMVPAAPPLAARRGQPPHAPQGVIVDEGTGFTGGIGIADEWDGDARDEHEWRDTHFRIRGPAVDGLRAAFLDNWAETDPVLYDPDYDHFPLQPTPGSTIAMCVRGASETGWSDVATLFRALLQAAEKSIRHHDRILRPRRRSARSAVRRGRPRHRRAGARPRAARRQAVRPARRARPRTSGCSIMASRFGASSRRCCTRRC